MPYVGTVGPISPVAQGEAGSTEKFQIAFRPLNGGNDLGLGEKGTRTAPEAPHGQDASLFRWRPFRRDLLSSCIR